MDLSEKQASKFLREFEKKNDLLKLKVNGLSVWLCLRTSIQNKLINFEFLSRSKIDLFKIFLLIRDVLRLIFIKESEILIKTAVSYLTDRSGNKYKDSFFDDLIEKLGKNCFKLIEVNDSNLYRERKNLEYKPANLTTLPLNAFASVISKFINNKQIEFAAEHITYAIEKNLSNVAVSKKWVLKKLKFFHALRFCYGILLRKSKTKIVITNNINDFALYAASLDLGITCCGVQHGLFYEFDSRALWDYMTPYRESLIRPSKLLVFGQYWKDKLLNNEFYNDNEIIVIGDPRIEKIRELVRFSSNKREYENKFEILFTSQGIQTIKACEFFKKATVLMQNRNIEYLLTIKLHPIHNFDQGIYEDYFSKNQNIKIVNDTSIYTKSELFQNTDVHISINSASLFETLGLGIPTCILGFPGYEINDDLILNRYAGLIKTPSDLIDLLEKYEEFKSGLNMPGEGFFHAIESSDRMYQLITENLNKK